MSTKFQNALDVGQSPEYAEKMQLVRDQGYSQGEMAEKMQLARDQGYSQAETLNFLSQSPEYAEKMQLARDQGYGDDEIYSFLSGEEERVTANKDISLPRKVLNCGRAGNPLPLGGG